MALELGSIPTENVVLASAVLTAYIAYQSRLNGLESQRDREQYLRSRLQDTQMLADSWSVYVDLVYFHERSGIIYRLKKFLTGNIKGESTVVVEYRGGVIPEAFWSSEKGQVVLDTYSPDVEHVETTSQLKPPVAKFTIDSSDDNDIRRFFSAVIEVVGPSE